MKWAAEEGVDQDDVQTRLIKASDKLMTEKGLLFDNLYADGNRTIRGFEGVFSSFPPLEVANMGLLISIIMLCSKGESVTIFTVTFPLSPL